MGIRNFWRSTSGRATSVTSTQDQQSILLSIICNDPQNQLEYKGDISELSDRRALNWYCNNCGRMLPADHIGGHFNILQDMSGEFWHEESATTIIFNYDIHKR